MYGVENRFKMQLLLGLKGSPLVGVRIVNFVPPEPGSTKTPKYGTGAASGGGHWSAANGESNGAAADEVEP